MLVHVPVGIFVLYFVDNIGLKKSFWISTTLNVIGTGVRLGWVTKWWQLDDALSKSNLKSEHRGLSLVSFHQFDTPSKSHFFIMVQLMIFVMKIQHFPMSSIQIGIALHPNGVIQYHCLEWSSQQFQCPSGQDCRVN